MRILILLISIYLPQIIFTQALAKENLKLQKVTDNTYAIVGPLGNRSTENLGNNANFGFVITSEGVLVIDPGGTYKGAQKIHGLIKNITDKKIIAVINTGGQDHRWLGNDYFKKLGAKLIASKAAVMDQKARVQDQFFRMGQLMSDEAIGGTQAVYADDTFDGKKQMTLGNTKIEIIHAGHAHTPGDSFVWLPEQKVMFTGDIVYTERMLGIGDQSNSKSWMEVYQKMAAYQPKYLIPGHGQPTTLAKANADTYDYLRFLRQAVAEFIENGGDISDISQIDQSKFKYLLNFETLAGRNAQRVFTEMEWE